MSTPAPRYVSVARGVALLVLVACLVLALLGRLDYIEALLIGALAATWWIP